MLYEVITLRILRRNPNRTCIELADPHHDTTDGDKRSCGEAILLRTKQRSDGQITAGQHFTVRLEHDPIAQVIQHQCLMRLGQTKLPWQACMTDRALW